MKKIIMLFIPVLFISCKEDVKKTERFFLNKAVESIEIENNYQWLVIIPGVGCHGCIQEGEYFMKKNIEKSNVLYVLTGFSSLKIFQQKTKIQIREHNNIYLDYKGLFDVPTNNSIYPCVIKMNANKIESHSFQKPGSYAFKQIK